jgi:hypothetical protein
MAMPFKIQWTQASKYLQGEHLHHTSISFFDQKENKNK